MTKRRLKSHFPSGINNSLGKSLLNQKTIKSCSHEKQSNFQNNEKLGSRTQESNIQEILTNYQLANKNFEVERSDLKIVSDVCLLEGLENQNLEELHDKYGHLLKIPRRPKPETYQNAEELESLEISQFLSWRRQLAKLSEGSNVVITPFERNLEIWRQLWRVVERSDIIVQIVDARNPLIFRSIDLENFVKEVDPQKKNLLLINKADLLTNAQIRCWKEYFSSNDIFAIFWSNKQTFNANLSEVTEKSLNDILVANEDCYKTFTTEEEEENINELINENDAIMNESNKKCIMDSCLKVNESEDRSVVIGMVGYPNVGKSSTINCLIGTKKTSVSSTPGKTKHFQTLIANDKLILCDCPGLVMPSFGLSNSEMILNGILPIAHMQDYYSPISLLCNRIPRNVLQRHYSILLPKREPVQAHDFLTTVAFLKGFMSTSGIPDCSRAARLILRDAVQGTLKWCIAPPGTSQEQFDNWTYKNSKRNTDGVSEKEIGKNLFEQIIRKDLLLDSNYINEEYDKTSKGRHIEKEFFTQMEDVKKGVSTMCLKNREIAVDGKRSKKHFNKRQLRRVFISTS
ncbi:CP-type G domain-containing protein [Meloidogyne graminicola]|uniref:Large subunit GTPase 1 homolog n=1 Tax=Meloidogyne graminicola TaxID=189291 RepID=A0A8S9ZPR2_9BILA|nr:CP-type G domain-containing protein [Meloidogyne graminicola]